MVRGQPQLYIQLDARPVIQTAIRHVVLSGNAVLDNQMSRHCARAVRHTLGVLTAAQVVDDVKT